MRKIVTGLALASLFAVQNVSAAKAAVLPGINLSGAEFAAGKLPGRDNWDYMFPKPEEISYFASHGMKLFRLPVLWERIQPTLSGPLDPGTLAHIHQFAAQVRQSGGATILDIHSYGQYRGQLIGSDAVPPAAFTDLWRRLAKEFRHDSSVLFGLMNEPKVKSATDWAATEQLAISTIRRAGAKNRILVSGVNWDGAHNFPQTNGAALAGLHDPAHKLIFEAHQYFDHDSSGTSDQCVPVSEVDGRLSPFADWLKAHHARGLLGEFGVGRNPQCLADLQEAMRYISSTAPVWFGWTYWAGGPLWGDYMFTADPAKDGSDRPQMKVLTDSIHH